MNSDATTEARRSAAADQEIVLQAGANAAPKRERAAPPARWTVMSHFVFAGKVGGAEHMLYNLIRGLHDEGTSLHLACGQKSNLDPAALDEFERIRRIAISESGGSRPRFLGEQLACLKGRLRSDAVLFPNYFVPPLVPGRLGRVATVIHDLQYRHLPQYFTARKRAWLDLALSHSMHRADRVVAISGFVAEDLARRFGERLARKITVVPNPVSWRRFDGAAGLAPVDRPYVLAVAAQYPHKNIETLIRAFAILAQRDADTLLVLCGARFESLRGTSGGTDLGALIRELGLTDRVVCTGYVDDNTLAGWYRFASAFAFPSVFEGFGMPAVEALGLGLPVLTTRCTALPETTLGLASYVEDPHSAEEWAEGLREILRDPVIARPSEIDRTRVRSAYDPRFIARGYLEACHA